MKDIKIKLIKIEVALTGEVSTKPKTDHIRFMFATSDGKLSKELVESFMQKWCNDGKPIPVKFKSELIFIIEKFIDDKLDYSGMDKIKQLYEFLGDNNSFNDTYSSFVLEDIKCSCVFTTNIESYGCNGIIEVNANMQYIMNDLHR